MTTIRDKVGNMHRLLLIAVAAVLLVWGAVGVVVLVRSPESVAGSVGAVAGVVGLIPAFYAAHMQSRSSVESITDEEREQLRGIRLEAVRNVLHLQPFPRFNRAGQPWVWLVFMSDLEILERSPYVTELEVRWQVDGSDLLARRETLRPGEVWIVPAGVGAEISAADIRSRMAHGELRWSTSDGSVRWRLATEVGGPRSGTQFGYKADTFDPEGSWRTDQPATVSFTSSETTELRTDR